MANGTDTAKEVTTVKQLEKEINELFDHYRNGMIRKGDLLCGIQKHTESVEQYEIAEYKRCVEAFGYKVIKEGLDKVELCPECGCTMEY